MSRRQKRPTNEYLEAARKLIRFVPGLQKYKRRKTLKPQEKSVIRKYENALRFTDHLIPLTKKQYKKMRDEAFSPITPVHVSKSGKIRGGKKITGIRAIQLRETAPNARIDKITDDMIVTSNGRTWLYWKLEKLNTAEWKRRRKKVLGDAAKTYFEQGTDAFPIEKIERLVRHAFEKIPKRKQIHLWTKSGRVAKGFTGINSFMDWLLSEHVRAYKNTDEWVNGIAILIYDNEYCVCGHHKNNHRATPPHDCKFDGIDGHVCHAFRQRR